LSGTQEVTLYAYIFDENGNHLLGIGCDLITWVNSEVVTIGPITGCSYPVPIVPNIQQAQTITATFVFAGANRPSISRSVFVTNEAVSVRHRGASMAKYGYTISVRPNAVVFSVPEGRTISGVNVYNLQGRRVFSRAGGTEPRITWNSARQPRGMYVVSMTMGDGAVVQRNLLLK
jgi:hypothetical protein